MLTGTLKGLGAALADLRKRRGLTQGKAAELLGTQQPEISRWEAEEVSMTLESLERCLETYGSTLAELATQIEWRATGVLQAGRVSTEVADALRRLEPKPAGGGKKPEALKPLRPAAG